MSHYEQVVLAGGGNRCMWQLGFWSIVAPRLGLKPKEIAGVSAGAATACIILADIIPEAMDYLTQAFRRNPRNAYPKNLLRGERVFPHAGIYRQALLDLIDAEKLAKLQQGPDIRIQIARIPRWLGKRVGTVVGFAAYTYEKKRKQPVHPVYGQRIGFYPEVISVRDCATTTELADLVLASSCTPPFTPMAYIRRKPALDGGLVDNVPIHALSPTEGKQLVLVTRCYKELPQQVNRHYVQPSRKIPVSSWDYTNPEALQATFDLGCYDGWQFLAEHAERQHVPPQAISNTQVDQPL